MELRLGGILIDEMFVFHSNQFVGKEFGLKFKSITLPDFIDIGPLETKKTAAEERRQNILGKRGRW